MGRRAGRRETVSVSNKSVWRAGSIGGQAGASLLFVLMLIGIGGIIMVALAAYASSSAKVTKNFAHVRAERYAADGAVKGAINWIKDQPQLALDPDYDPNYDPSADNNGCIYQSDGITVTCETPEGSGSGVPPEKGSLPPETMLLLSTRHNEPQPYSFSQCDSTWDSIVRFFTRDTQGGPEFGLTAEKSRRSTLFGAGSCEPRTRGNGPVVIAGNVVSAGKIQAKDSLALTATGKDGTGVGTIMAKYGCVSVSCSLWSATRSAPGKPWNGTPQDSDPGRKTVGTLSPIGDIRDEFLPIGFKADGSLRSGYSMPVRTTAYVYDKTNTGGSATVPKYLKAISSCADPAAASGTPIIFLPGWYKKSEILSAYTAGVNTCVDRTFWFTPNAGPDNELLTKDDETGAFFLDFTGNGTNEGRACGTMSKPTPMTTAVAARWCLGGSGDQSYNTKPRVVVGWPRNWEPFPSSGTAGPNTPAYGTPVPVKLDTAANASGELLSYWAQTGNAKKIDGTYASYVPCQVWIFTCPSLGKRTLRLEDFGTKTTGNPLAVSGAPNGRIYVEARYGITHGANLGTPWLDVDVLDDKGVAVSCGSYQMINNATVDFDGSSPTLPASKKYVFTDAQAKTLADTCGAVEQINNMRFSMRISGNIWNNPLSKLFFDGVEIRFDSYKGASFPVGTDNVYGSQQPAKSDCDVTKPGAQLIFSGESNMYIADGSLEVCGGPDPDRPATAQVIGIYGVPAVGALKPSSNPYIDSASAGSGSTSLANAGNLREIAEPAAQLTSKISYKGRCWGLIGIQTCGPIDGGAKDIVFNYPAFTPPSGYSIDTIAARATYQTEGAWYTITTGGDASRLKAGTCNIPARQTKGQMRTWANEDTGAGSLVLRSSSRNCLSHSNTAGAAWPASTVRWKADVPDEFSFFVGGGCFVIAVTCTYTQDDYMDGIELDVTIKPNDTSVPMLRPQFGCITAHPNYQGGEGTPDCAVVRADSFSADDATEGYTTGLPVRGKWVGRLSVKGTIYAPSSAIEIDDNDVGYPIATRGVILRHLRISGAQKRTNYSDPWFGGKVDTNPAARVAVLTACSQTAAVQATPVADRKPCGENVGDRVLAKAGVNFMTPQTTGQNQANAPVIQWWSDRLTKGAG